MGTVRRAVKSQARFASPTLQSPHESVLEAPRRHRALAGGARMSPPDRVGAVTGQVLGRVLPPFLDQPAAAAPLGYGLINKTFLVTTGGARYVLQRVNPIFDPAIHENIRAVTERLAARGLVTPRLLPTREGGLFLDLAGDGV